MSDERIPQKFKVPADTPTDTPDPEGGKDLGNVAGSNAFVNNPLAQNLNYFSAPYRNQRPETNRVGLPLVLKENPSRSDLTKEPAYEVGIPSFINPYALLTFPTKWGKDNSAFASVIDDPTNPIKFSSSNVKGRNGVNNIEPSVYNLVTLPPDGSNSEIPVLGAKTPYRYTDFLYCKYYGKIPNNFLITLRRYPAPTFDNLGIPQTVDDPGTEESQFNFKPIAQAVTWLGDETENKLSEILGFDVSMNWKLYESQVETYNGNEQDASQGPNMFAQVSKFLQITSGLLGAKSQVNSPADQANYNYDPYANGPYSHRVYGPVNVIGKTYKRDRGLDFKQSFNINFHYELKSISGINPKAAMLDIMNNMLQLTYNNAAFWGGANRYFAQRPVYPFLGGRDGMNAWYSGNPTLFVKSISNQLNAPNGPLDLIGKLFDDLAADPIAALKALVTNGSSLAMKIIGRGRAPDIVGMKALLTGEPIGEWHMVVGNPYSPILQVGNLICTGAKFKFNDILGADNFPTELKVTISLEHGRPRDMGDIASMFNEGEGRMYFAPMNKAEYFVSTSMFNSKNDNSNSKGDRTRDANKQLEGKNGVIKSIEVGKKTQNRYVIPDVAKTGAGAQVDQMLNDMAFPFTYGQHGHELAIKMGLASSGTKAKTYSKAEIDAASKVQKQKTN
jgi:hypothetical protein